MRLYVLLRNIGNRISYGSLAPKHGQRIHVDAAECTCYLPPGSRPYSYPPRRLSGMVLGGDWDINPDPIERCPKVYFCLLHWQKNVPWEKTGCYEYSLDIIKKEGMLDGMRNIDEVKARYRMLDLIYEQVKKDRRLMNSEELELARGKNREDHGIMIHLDRNGKPVFGDSGCHRMAMAVSLGLEKIPAKIGIVHADYISGWIERMRQYGD